MQLETNRLILRRLTPKDLPSFQAYRHDPDVGRYQGWEPQSDEDASQFIEEMSSAEFLLPGQWLQIGIADKESDQLIGDIGLCLKGDALSAEIGFSLCSKSQGKGLAFEAVSLALQLLFEQSSLEKIEGITDSRNAPSIHLLECLGMTRIKVIETEFRGSPCTEYLYSISRSEFENSKLLNPSV